MISKLAIFLLNFFDYFHKKKIINFLKKNIQNIDTLIDVGGHKGESIELFSNSFKIKNLYSFEPVLDNYNCLSQTLNKFNQKFPQTEFKIFNCGLGVRDEILNINLVDESSSSTLSNINFNSSYYQKKKKFLKRKDISFFTKKIEVKIKNLDNFIINNKIKKVDLIKIDTEGHEYYVLQGFSKNLQFCNLVFFEHHYDNMINKGYTFGDIHSFLISNNFTKIFKIKMPFRKTFEYIYQNKKYIKL